MLQIPKKGSQFRDLRTTAATHVGEASGIKDAQALLGHTTRAAMTKYIRHKVDRKVKSAI